MRRAVCQLPLSLPGARRRRFVISPSEYEIQCQLVAWAAVRAVQVPALALLYAVPNGGKRPPKTAREMKASGQKSGVPDLCLPIPRGGFHGCYLELKSRTGSLSPEQRWWLAELTAQGYCARVAKSLEEGIAILETYLSEGSP